MIDRDADVAIVTERDADGIDVIRHSTAHLLAYAVKELFPEAQVTIGPVIENGFYYDFAYKRPFTPEDLAAIEQKMAELAKKDEPVVREVWKRDDAVKFFESIGEKYKAEIIASIPANEDISLYREGDFIDLCRGPHVPSSGKLKVFKLTKVAGAYWRGDQANEQLQRIYGTAWGREGGPGRLSEDARGSREARPSQARQGARPVSLSGRSAGPRVLASEGLGDLAGGRAVHARRLSRQRLSGSQRRRRFSIARYGKSRATGKSTARTCSRPSRRIGHYALKPMNCPGHVQIYNANLHSYRELPLRYGEFGFCHRNESSGALHGLMRVRGFVQDDGHIFCTEDQILDECVAYTALLQKVYRDFGFEQVLYKVATRPEQRIGSDEIWDKVGSGADRIAAAVRRRVRRVARRGRFLRSEDRVHAERRDRSPVAVRHDAG